MWVVWTCIKYFLSIWLSVIQELSQRWIRCGSFNFILSDFVSTSYTCKLESSRTAEETWWLLLLPLGIFTIKILTFPRNVVIFACTRTIMISLLIRYLFVLSVYYFSSSASSILLLWKHASIAETFILFRSWNLYFSLTSITKKILMKSSSEIRLDSNLSVLNYISLSHSHEQWDVFLIT